MSRAADRIYGEVMRAIHADYGVVKAAGQSPAVIRMLAEAAAGDRLRKRITYLERAVAALAPAEPPKMPDVAVRPLDQRDHAEWMAIIGHLGGQR